MGWYFNIRNKYPSSTKEKLADFNLLLPATVLRHSKVYFDAVLELLRKLLNPK